MGGTCGEAICGIDKPEMGDIDIGVICGMAIPGICGAPIPSICRPGTAGICGSCIAGICGMANPGGPAGAPVGPVDAAAGSVEGLGPDAPPEMIRVNSLGPLGTADVNGAGLVPLGTKTCVAPPAVERGMKVSAAGITASLFNREPSGQETLPGGSELPLEEDGMILASVMEPGGRLNVPGSALSSAGAISPSLCTWSGMNILVKAPGLPTGADLGLKSSSGTEFAAD